MGLIKPGWVVALREHQFYRAMWIIFGEQVIWNASPVSNPTGNLNLFLRNMNRVASKSNQFFFWKFLFISMSAQSFYIDLFNYSLFQAPDSNVQRSWKTDAKNAGTGRLIFARSLLIRESGAGDLISASFSWCLFWKFYITFLSYRGRRLKSTLQTDRYL